MERAARRRMTGAGSMILLELGAERHHAPSSLLHRSRDTRHSLGLCHVTLRASLEVNCTSCGISCRDSIHDPNPQLFGPPQWTVHSVECDRTSVHRPAHQQRPGTKRPPPPAYQTVTPTSNAERRAGAESSGMPIAIVIRISNRRWENAEA